MINKIDNITFKDINELINKETVIFDIIWKILVQIKLCVFI